MLNRGLHTIGLSIGGVSLVEELAKLRDLLLKFVALRYYFVYLTQSWQILFYSFKNAIYMLVFR